MIERPGENPDFVKNKCSYILNIYFTLPVALISPFRFVHFLLIKIPAWLQHLEALVFLLFLTVWISSKPRKNQNKSYIKHHIGRIFIIKLQKQETTTQGYQKTVTFGKRDISHSGS